MKMLVSAERAEQLLLSVPHSTCQSGMRMNWRAGDDGTVAAASFLWLYCWAKTGMNSESARERAVDVFEEIFGLSFGEVDRRVEHDWARRMRYASDLPDKELTRRLDGLEQKPTGAAAKTGSSQA